MNQEEKIGFRMYGGLFLVTLATLMLEILLTRIFSVTMWYHFAFMAISIAMFGMTVGAVAVYLAPARFAASRARVQMSRYSLYFAVSTVLSFLVHLHVPFKPALALSGMASVLATFGALSLPFFFSGICVTLALTRFPGHVSRLYAADLGGAAVGSFLLYLVLGPLDSPSAIVLVAALASVGAFLFARGTGGRGLARLAGAMAFFFAALCAVNALYGRGRINLFPIKWVKGAKEPRLLYEKWSSYARVAVRDYIVREPMGWGLSADYPLPRPVNQRYMDIDGAAGTVLTEFKGRLDNLEFLKYDITNLVHYIRPRARMLVVGTGGGRDVLSALVFGQKSVLGVEINGDIIRAVNRRFGYFTGHLDRQPGVRFVNDEARSYLTRSRENFDIIQISLIDTWSATAAGAFVLSENSLYTVEAWKVFMSRLGAGGVLSVSRWFTRSLSGEMYRLASLAAAALRAEGVKDPRRHLLIARHRVERAENAPGVGTLLLCRRPFGHEEVAAIEQVCKRMGFELVLSPEGALDNDFTRLTAAAGAAEFIARYPLNISPPTDDSPYFFNMLRFKDIFGYKRITRVQDVDNNLKAVMILSVLLIIILFLVILCIVVPLLLTSRKATFRGTAPFFIFFACIGIAFMLIEIAQVQRLSVFLGHPSYSLTVVLFSLLLACSLGSLLSRRVRPDNAARQVPLLFALLMAVLLAVGLITPPLLKAFRGNVTPVRILVAVTLLFAQGILMGIAFPLGMAFSQRHSPAIAPWYWGINGALSVFASVLAMAISLNWGIAVSYWTGLACYFVAAAAVLLMVRRAQTAVGQAADHPAGG